MKCTVLRLEGQNEKRQKGRYQERLYSSLWYQVLSNMFLPFNRKEQNKPSPFFVFNSLVMHCIELFSKPVISTSTVVREAVFLLLKMLGRYLHIHVMERLFFCVCLRCLSFCDIDCLKSSLFLSETKLFYGDTLTRLKSTFLR